MLNVSGCSWGFIALLVLLVWLAGPVSLAQNLVTGGTFEAVRGNDLPAGWEISGGYVSDAMDRRDPAEGKQSWSIRFKEPILIRQTFPVTPRTNLFFSAKVHAKARVVASVGKIQIAYSELGEWQEIAGLIPVGDETTIDITIRVSRLDNGPGSIRLDDITLRPFVAPTALTRKHHSPATTLVDQGQANAAIIYPAHPPEYRGYAEAIQSAVRQRTGIDLPLASDVEATTAGPPLVRPEYENTHLILLGRLGINRAIWPAYNRYLAAVDGHYPGGDGYVLRTAVNPLRGGANHLIVGGSSEAGAKRAVDALVRSIQEQPESSSLTLPWLLETDLQGECLERLKAHDALWASSPLDASLPRIEPGYGTVRRWYENAMGYYWTGWPGYRQRAVELLEPVLADKAYTHHYIAEFFVRVFDMVDDSDLYDEPTRRSVELLLAQNFMDFCTDVGGDLSWMTTFAPPYDAIMLTNRHQIAPWMSDFQLASYFDDYFTDAGHLGKVAAFRRQEKGAFFDHLVAERWDTSLPGGVTTEHESEIAQCFLRYALTNDRYAFFESGHARNLPGIERVNHVNGAYTRPSGPVETKRILGALATYYQDGRYVDALRQLPDTTPFMNRYLGGIHNYQPGPEVVRRDADELIGVREPAPMPHRTSNLASLNAGKFTAPTVKGRVLDFVSFRSGFSKTDDYLAINGLATLVSIPGDLISFHSRGVNWLGIHGDTSYTAPSSRYADHNALHVMRTDRWLGNEPLYASAASRRWVADLEQSGGVALTCDPFVGTRWDRTAVWLRPGVMLVRDRVTARQSGSYQVSVHWWPIGDASWDGKVWSSRQGDKTLRITPLGEAFTPDARGAGSTGDPRHPKPLRLVYDGELAAGQSVEAYTLLHALDPQSEQPLGMAIQSPGTLEITAADDTSSQDSGESTQRVLFEPSGIDGLESDAAVLVFGAESLQMMGGTFVKLQGKEAVKLADLGSLSVDFTSGQLRVDASVDSAAAPTVQLVGVANKLAEAQAGSLDTKAFPAPSELGRWMEQPVRGSAASTATAQATPESDPTADSAITDESDDWSVGWTYEGMRQPLQVEPTRKVAADTIDLGRPVRIAAIYPKARSGAWVPRPLPEVIAFAPDHFTEIAPDKPEDWQAIEETARWRPGARTGNYGQADAEPQDSQVLEPAAVTTRYLKAEGIDQLIILDADQLGTPDPMRLIRLDGDGSHEPALLVAPVLWPKFTGWQPPWRDRFAVLEMSGAERFQASTDTRLQAISVIPLGEAGAPRIVTAELNGDITVRDMMGQTQRQASLFEMHRDFNTQFGRPNTRTPAGGYTMPFAMGAWRASPDAEPGLVVARYHGYSFLDSELKFEGLLFDGSYVQPAMLPMGIDFDGDGADEQVTLGRGMVLRVHGPMDKRVQEPTGYKFYPEIYHIERLEEPAWDDRIDGAPVLAMQPLEHGRANPQANRFVFCARENYVGVYDGVERRWAFSWTPLTALRGAAVTVDRDNLVRWVAASEDGLIWTIDWKQGQDTPTRYTARYLPAAVQSVGPAADGAALLSTREGLYRVSSEGRFTRLAAGDFVRATQSGTQPDLIHSVTRDGQVAQHHYRAAGSPQATPQ